HRMDSTRGTGLDHFSMLEGAGEDGDGGYIAAGQQFVNTVEEQVRVELETARVALPQLLVWFHDGHQFAIPALTGLGDEAASMIVGQPNDCETEHGPIFFGRHKLHRTLENCCKDQESFHRSSVIGNSGRSGGLTSFPL